jgi:pyruvate dehydrogenase E2 component (dihydrolipoamide acetyltransferase)
MATAIYAPPSEGKIYGTLEIDVTAVLAYIREQREQGNYLTITHLTTAALARALAYDAPEVNCFVRRGRLVHRDYVDIMVSVSIRDHQEMSAVIVRDAHRKPVSVIAREIQERAQAEREGREGKSMRNKYLLSRIPWPFRRWIYRGVRWWVNELGFELKSAGLSERAFGSLLLSNIGTHGLTTGMPALFPAAKIPGVVVMGKIEEKPVVRDGEIVVRSIMPCTATFDHRIVDGAQVGRFARGVARRLEHPAELERLPEEQT